MPHLPGHNRPFTSFLTQGMQNTNRNIGNFNIPGGQTNYLNPPNQFNRPFGNLYNPPGTPGFEVASPGAGGTGTGGGGYMGGAQPGGAQYEDPCGSLGGMDNIGGTDPDAWTPGDYGGHAGYGDFWHEAGWSGSNTSDAPLNWGISGLDMNNDGDINSEDYALWEQYQEAIGTDPGAAGGFLSNRPIWS